MSHSVIQRQGSALIKFSRALVRQIFIPKSLGNVIQLPFELLKMNLGKRLSAYVKNLLH